MIKRRRFLQSSAFALTGSVISKKLPLAQSGKVQAKIREYRTLGRTGLRVSDIALGAGVAQEPSVINHAVDLGVNYVDTAEGYFRGQSERVVGEVARKRRQDFIIAGTHVASVKHRARMVWRSTMSSESTLTSLNINNRILRYPLTSTWTINANRLFAHAVQDFAKPTAATDFLCAGG